MSNKFVKLVEELNNEPVFVVNRIEPGYNQNADETFDTVDGEPVGVGKTEKEAVEKTLQYVGGKFVGFDDTKSGPDGKVFSVQGKQYLSQYLVKPVTSDIMKQKLKIGGYLG